MDYFALLEQPRRPWLDPGVLKEKFLAASATAHPDRAHGGDATQRQAAQQNYTELNAAYNCLREPKDRLRHLIELERGHKPSDLQRIPPDLMETFMQVGQLCREADGFLKDKANVTSPLLRVRLFEAGQEWTEKLMGRQREIVQRQETLLQELQRLDQRWIASGQDRETLLAALEELYRLLSYFARWQAQLQDRIVQLSL